jgi:PAS domain-containing protein
MLLTTVHYFLRQQEADEADAAQPRRGRRARGRPGRAPRAAALGASERRFHSAFTHASIGMALLSIDGRILQANPALASLLGLGEEALVASDFQACSRTTTATLEEQLGLASAREFEGFARDALPPRDGSRCGWRCTAASSPNPTPKLPA